MTSEQWAEKLGEVLRRKGIINDEDLLTDILAEAQIILESAMQEAAEGGVI